MPQEGDGPPRHWLEGNWRDGLLVFAFQERASIFKNTPPFSKTRFHFQNRTSIFRNALLFPKTHGGLEFYILMLILKLVGAINENDI